MGNLHIAILTIVGAVLFQEFLHLYQKVLKLHFLHLIISKKILDSGLLDGSDNLKGCKRSMNPHEPGHDLEVHR